MVEAVSGRGQSDQNDRNQHGYQAISYTIALRRRPVPRRGLRYSRPLNARGGDSVQPAIRCVCQ